MQSLLRWSIENSTPQDNAPTDKPPAERKDLDPKIIDMILGRPDAERMKEAMSIAVDTSKSEEDRVTALDDLEMLVEHIDNANDIGKLSLWEPLQSLLTSSTSSAEIKMQALWVIGTAIQNNPSAQEEYLALKPIGTLLSFLTPTSETQTLPKAIYALSGLLKHNVPAVRALSEDGLDGWTKIRDTLKNPQPSVRRKAIFLLNSLLTPTETNTSAPKATQPDGTQLLIQDNPQPRQSAHSQATAVAALSLSSAAPNVVLPDSQPAAAPDIIHPNSHAVHLQDPNRSNTSPITLNAFKDHGFLDVVISDIISPSNEPNADLEEALLRLLHTFIILCKGGIQSSQKQSLKQWLDAEKKKEDETQLAGRWGFAQSELRDLLKSVGA